MSGHRCLPGRHAYVPFRESVAIIDANDVCVAVLVAPPKGESFRDSGRAMADLIEAQRSERPRAWAHALGKKRGDFPSLSAGINYNFTEAVSPPYLSHPPPPLLTYSVAPKESGSQQGTTRRGRCSVRQSRRATYRGAYER